MLPRLDIRKWSPTLAAHLLNRAGFGGTPGEIEALHSLGHAGALSSLLEAPDDSASFPKPSWAEPTNIAAERMEAAGMTQEARRTRFQELQRQHFRNTAELGSWWLGRMRHSPCVLREKLTLFWHGHFATSMEKVRNAYLMWQQNEMLRQKGLGPFPDLVKAVARDPAMMIYLDTRDSKRSNPNENFARELLELFTLGIGNYSEADIKEVARAFTGFKLNPADLSFRFAEIQHDEGPKVCLGIRGKLDGNDVIDRIVTMPACHRLIATKLWSFFAGPPTEAFASILARSFAATRLDTRSFLRELFSSAAFYDPALVRNQIKSPIQWVVGTSKLLGAELPPTLLLTNALRQLGQLPFFPPSVKGWDAGHAWITTSTLLTRYNLAGYFVGATRFNVSGGPGGRGNQEGREVRNFSRPDMLPLVPAGVRTSPEKLVAHLSLLLFQRSLSGRETAPFLAYLAEQPQPVGDGSLRGLIHLMMSTPEFQLT